MAGVVDGGGDCNLYPIQTLTNASCRSTVSGLAPESDTSAVGLQLYNKKIKIT
jgi:hypothetical protein